MKTPVASILVVLALGCFVAAQGVAARDLAPAPAPAAHEIHGNSSSLFVIEALMATFTRSSATSLQGTLRLQNVSPTVSWFSETPRKAAGHLSAQKVAGPEFYLRAGEPSSWLDNANFALYAPKNNASATESTFIFGINNAPVVSEGGSVWSMDVTMIPSNTDSIYAATSVSSFSAQVFPAVTSYAPVALFVDGVCAVYNRYTGYIYYYYAC
jgi:hypothetical protein